MGDWRTQVDTLIQPAAARSSVTQAVAIAPGALAGLGAMAAAVTESRRALVMADDAGFAAAGPQAIAALRQAGLEADTLILPADPLPKASVAAAAPFRDALAADPDAFPVSVGSGVINDLVKFAAFETGRRYLTVATAASMDGYTSAGAPLARDGFKVTIPTRAPIAMLADLDVLCAAPAEMNGWGYGDLAGKIPAGGDWMIADALGAETLDSRAWPMVQDHLHGWLAGPEGIRHGATDAVARLFVGLTAVGFAMETHGTSRPASGAEHQIAHMWEMEGHTHAGRKVSHGAAVAVGCVAALALFDWLLAQDLAALDIGAVVAAAPPLDARLAGLRQDISDARVAARAEAEVRAKHLPPGAHRARLTRLVDAWPSLRARLSDRLIRQTKMVQMLTQAGVPTHGHHIGVPPAHLLATLRGARHIRSRYTIFDLLHETGLTEAAFAAVLPRLGPGATEAAE